MLFLARDTICDPVPGPVNTRSPSISADRFKNREF